MEYTKILPLEGHIPASKYYRETRYTGGNRNQHDLGRDKNLYTRGMSNRENFHSKIKNDEYKSSSITQSQGGVGQKLSDTWDKRRSKYIEGYSSPGSRSRTTWRDPDSLPTSGMKSTITSGKKNISVGKTKTRLNYQTTPEDKDRRLVVPEGKDRSKHNSEAAGSRPKYYKNYQKYDKFDKYQNYTQKSTNFQEYVNSGNPVISPRAVTKVVSIDKSPDVFSETRSQKSQKSHKSYKSQKSLKSVMSEKTKSFVEPQPPTEEDHKGSYLSSKLAKPKKTVEFEQDLEVEDVIPVQPTFDPKEEDNFEHDRQPSFTPEPELDEKNIVERYDFGGIQGVKSQQEDPRIEKYEQMLKSVNSEFKSCLARNKYLENALAQEKEERQSDQDHIACLRGEIDKVKLEKEHEVNTLPNKEREKYVEKISSLKFQMKDLLDREERYQSEKANFQLTIENYEMSNKKLREQEFRSQKEINHLTNKLEQPDGARREVDLVKADYESLKTTFTVRVPSNLCSCTRRQWRPRQKL